MRIIERLFIFWLGSSSLAFAMQPMSSDFNIKAFQDLISSDCEIAKITSLISRIQHAMIFRIDTDDKSYLVSQSTGQGDQKDLVMGVKVVISTATLDDFHEVVACLNSTFCAAEPTSTALKLTTPMLSPFVEVFGKRSIMQKNTFIAKDAHEKFIGGLIAEDFALEDPDDPTIYSDELAPVYAIVDILDHWYKERHTVEPGSIFHILMMGVFPEFSGQSIGEQLIISAENFARKQGYKGIIAEATGPVSQKIFSKSGYETIFKVKYREFIFKEKHVFSNITDCESCDLVFKAL